MIETTKDDFEYFKKCFLEYQKMFQLIHYAIYFFHEKLEEKYASISVVPGVASIRFNTEWEDEGREKNEYEIRKVARHECEHLLFARLEGLALSRTTFTEDVLEESEFLVRRFDYILTTFEGKYARDKNSDTDI